MKSTEEQQKVVLETFDFVYANMFYEFKGDSVYYTDAGGGGIIKNKGSTLKLVENITSGWFIFTGTDIYRHLEAGGQAPNLSSQFYVPMFPLNSW